MSVDASANMGVGGSASTFDPDVDGAPDGGGNNPHDKGYDPEHNPNTGYDKGSPNNPVSATD